MDDPQKRQIKRIIRKRWSLMARIRDTEDKLARLKSELALANVMLACFGHKLPKRQPPKRMFRGRNLKRRVLDMSRGRNNVMTIEEITDQLATKDGLSLNGLYLRQSAMKRIRGAMRRSKRKAI